MQADGRLVAAGLAAAPRYSGMADALRQISASEGLAGLWRGAAPAVQRAALVNLGELATYDSAKQAVLASGVTGGDNVAAHALASVCSGFFAALASTPADVVKTRMMNQSAAALAAASSGGGGAGGAVPSHAAVGTHSSAASASSNKSLPPPSLHYYSSSLDCLLRTARFEGLRGLYKGFWPTWARLGPWQLVFWTSYEQLRHLAQLGSF